MSPDDFQKAWKAESDQTRVTINDAEWLEKVVDARQDFRSTIFFRDLREVSTSLVLIPVWIVMGTVTSQPWTWYLMLPALIWVAGFMLVDRAWQRKKKGNSEASLLTSARASLSEVEHQIWLLRNVVWWYLAPFAVPLIIYFLHTALLTTGIPTSSSAFVLAVYWAAALGIAGVLCAFVFVLYGWVYRLNQRAARQELEPRRQELLALIAGLSDEAAGGVTGEYPLLLGEKSSSCSGRRRIVAGLCWFAILIFGLPAILYGGYRLEAYFGGDYPKVSPFEAVRWADDAPEVSVGGEWFKLLSLNDIPAAEIVEFSKKTYGAKWRKRFEEDLVELLTRMGHAPEDTVSLVLKSVVTGEERTLDAVPMTRANRNAIRNAAQARERASLPKTAPSREPPEGAETGDTALAEELETIRNDFGFPAMAAFTLRGGEIVEQATVGTRSSKDERPVGLEAPWHLGSNTKAMTATVAGMLVEEGLLRWDSTIGEVLGAAAPDMDKGHRDTTLAMLLHHRSGIVANIGWYSAPQDRVACAAQILSKKPGKKGDFLYSNAGYVVAGAMMEVVTGKVWETLMQERLFGPLGMNDTSFGAPSTPGAPWGHQSGLFGWKPVHPGTRGADNAPVLGPAGTVHATMADYARFIAAHLAGAQGKDGIVSAETFTTLQSPPDGGDYAMGWSVHQRSWAGGRTLSHSGSNTMWFATVWLAPEKDLAFFAATNVGGDKAFRAVDKAIETLIWRQVE